MRANIHASFRQAASFTLALATPLEDLECRHNSDSLFVVFAVNYTEGCHNVNDMFTQETSNDTFGYRTCSHADPFCGNDEWTAIAMRNNYSPLANYSQIQFELEPRHSDNRFVNGTLWENDDVILRVFDGEDCEESSPDNPFYQFGNCGSPNDVPDDGCAELPYGVRSLQVLRSSEENNQSESCLTAAERGAGETSHSAGLGWVTLAALSASALLFLH